MGTMNWFATGLTVAILALGFAGCSSSGGGGECRAAGRALCQRACDCRDGPECALSSGGADGGGGATLTFDSQADCVGLVVTLGCSGGGDPGVDFGACTSAVAAGMCVTDGAGDSSFQSPTACEAP